MSKNFTVKKTLYTSMTAIALLGAGAATTGVALMSQGATQTVHAASAPVWVDKQGSHPLVKDSEGFWTDPKDTTGTSKFTVATIRVVDADTGKLLDTAYNNEIMDIGGIATTLNIAAPEGYKFVESSAYKTSGAGDTAFITPTSGTTNMTLKAQKNAPDADTTGGGTDFTVDTSGDGDPVVTEDNAGAPTDTPVQENTDTSTPAQDTTETPDNQGSPDNTDTTSDNKTPITGADFDETWLSPEGYQFAISAASNRPKFIPGTHSTELNPGQTGDFFNLYDAIQNARNAGPSTGWTSAMVAALQEPYTNAERVFALEDAPQTQIDAVTDALNSTKVDKTDLNDTLSRAASYQSKEYVDATFQTLQNAIKAAQTINSDTHATQAQVDAASQAVQDAIKGLKSVPDQVISDPGATTDPDDSSSTTGEDGKDTGATAKDDGTSIRNFEEIDLKKDPNQFDQNGNGSDSTSTGDTPAKKDDSQKPTGAAKAAPKAKTSPKAKTDTKHNDRNTFPKTGEVATNFDLFGTIVIALSALLGITYKKQRN